MGRAGSGSTNNGAKNDDEVIGQRGESRLPQLSRLPSFILLAKSREAVDDDDRGDARRRYRRREAQQRRDIYLRIRCGSHEELTQV